MIKGLGDNWTIQSVDSGNDRGMALFHGLIMVAASWATNPNQLATYGACLVPSPHVVTMLQTWWERQA